MCDDAISLITVNLRMGVLSNWTDEVDTLVVEFQDFNAPAQGHRASKSLMLVLSASDSIASPESGEFSHADACTAGNPIHM